jgi:hypothetical protein
MSPRQNPAEPSETESVKVLLRVRPFNQREIDLHTESNEGKDEWDQRPIRSIVEFDGTQCTVLNHQHPEWQEKERFGFDECFWSIPSDVQESPNAFASQETVFERAGRPILQQAWKGYNTCFFAYGQTGAGKTHSMMGGEGEQAGLIPRISQELFVEMARMQVISEQHKETSVSKFKCEVRYMEIYNEHVADLMWTLSTAPPEIKQKVNPENMKVRASPATGVWVEHLTAIEVTNWDEMLKLIQLGESNRHTAATKMNERSSRSHAIFKITLTQTTTTIPKKKFEKPNEIIRESTINLVDLAGSERNKKSQATGDRLKEAVNINKSLSCLKGVIDVLVDNSTTKGPKKRPPYRDSTLTSLLQDSLGGNSKTFMLVALSPHENNAEETLQTLRYGSRARQIVHTVKVNENAAGRMMLDLEEELERTRKELERSDSNKPEHLEDLKVQITEQTATIAALQQATDDRNDKIQKLQAVREKATKQREAMALANILEMVQLNRVRAEQRAEYTAQKEKLQLLTTDKDALVTRRDVAEKEQDALRDAIEDHKLRSAELELDMEQCRKKNSKLEMYKRELQTTVDEQEAELANLKQTKIALMMKARLRCAQTRLEGKRVHREQQQKNDSEIASIKGERERERDALMASTLTSHKLIQDDNDALQRELDGILAETRKLETERGSQVVQLEEELRMLQAENQRKTADNEARIATAKAEWEKRSQDMVTRMQDEYDTAVRTWQQKRETAVEDDQRAFDSNRERFIEETKEMEEQWAEEIQRIRTEGDDVCAGATKEWEGKLSAKLLINKGLRVQLRAIEAREQEYGEMMRRVAAVVDGKKNGRDDPAAGSSEYKKIYALMVEFQNEYSANAPSKYTLQHLLREDYDQTRCEQVPLIGVSEEQLAAAAGSPRESMLKLRPRSPGRHL